MGQTFGRFNTERPREQKVFDTFENIGPTDYEFNFDNQQGRPFGSSEGDYGFGMDPYDEPRARNFNLLGDQFENPFGSSDDDYGFQMDSPFGSNFGLNKVVEQAAQPLTPTSRLTNQSQFDDLYHPESAASTRFNELIAQYPQREDAGFGRKLVASMIAAKDPKASQDFLDQPFNQKFLDWKAQIEPAQKAADLERTTNVNERQYAYQVRQAELARERNDLVRQKQAGAQFNFDGPTVKRYRADGTLEDTGFKTGNLDDTTLFLLQQQGRMQVVGAQQAGADRRVGMEGEQDRLTKGTAPGFDPGATENQNRIGVNSRGKEVAEDPQLGKFMRANPSGGTYTIVKPADRGRIWGGGHDPNTPTVSQYLQIFRYIHGREPLSSEMAPDAPTNTTPTTPQSNRQFVAPNHIVTPDDNKMPPNAPLHVPSPRDNQRPPNAPLYETPDPDANLPRTPMTPGLIPEGTIQIKNGKRRVMGKNGAWIYE